MTQLLDHGIDSLVAYESPTMKSMDAVAFALERGESRIAEAIAKRDSPANLERRLREAGRVAALNNVS